MVASAKRQAKSLSPPRTALKVDASGANHAGSGGALHSSLPPLPPMKSFPRSAEAQASLKAKKKEADIWATVKPFARHTTEKDFDHETMMKLITWNVAGLRGMLKKDSAILTSFLQKENPDILCLQETKLNPSEPELNAKLGVVPNYQFFDHISYTKKGYSGTRVYLHQQRICGTMQARVTCGFCLDDCADAQSPPEGLSTLQLPQTVSAGSDGITWPIEDEGRVQTVWLHSNDQSIPSKPGEKRSRKSSSSSDASGLLPQLAVVNTYVTNSGMTLERLPYRVLHFDPAMRSYLVDVQKRCLSHASSPCDGVPAGLIWTGDLNVAEKDFDRYFSGTWKTMQECSGFTPEERFSFRKTLDALGGGADVFRELYPNAGPSYTFWSKRIRGKEKGLGWRLDYFVVSKQLIPYIVDVFPMTEIDASDHCPVQMWMRRRK